MTRLWCPLCLALCLSLAVAQPPAEQEPPEEDANLVKPEYAFNPLQAKKELQVGLFNMKRGAYKGAAERFEEATKWDPSLADAYWMLGQARARLGDDKAAREAYQKYLEMEPDGRYAGKARKLLAEKPKPAAKPAS